MTSPTPFIMPERLAQTDAYTQIKDPTGSGPFKMVMSEWQPGHKVVFARNADYVPRAEPPGRRERRQGRQGRPRRVALHPRAGDRAAGLEGRRGGYLGEPAQRLRRGAGGTTPTSRCEDYPGFVGTVRFNWLLPAVRQRQDAPGRAAVADQRDYMAAMAGDPENWRTCFSVYACDGCGDPTRRRRRPVGPARLGQGQAAGRRGRLQRASASSCIDPADIPQLHAEALVTEHLLKRLGLNVELATTEWGTAIKRINVKEPVDQGGWSVFVTAFATYDQLNPATNRNLRAPGRTGTRCPAGRATRQIEALRTAWFAATDEAQRRESADKIQRRALRDRALYLPTGQYIARRAFLNSLSGIPDSPIPVLWNIEKR